MENIEITKDMLLHARDYIPNAEKVEWVNTVADKCFDRLAIQVNDEEMPPMYMANYATKSRYLMAAIVGKYLGLSFGVDEDDENLMAETDFDVWAGSHVFCQLDRWKSDAEVRNKCFDILYDYHDLEKRLSTQINGLLAAQNDPVVRQSQQMADAAMKDLPKILGLLKELQATAEAQEADAEANKKSTQI